MTKSLDLTPELLAYVAKVGVREHPALARCRAETAAMGGVSIMQIAPEQGALMAMLAKLVGAKRCLEIGTFTGYSSLAVALALPDGGHIDACDISDEYVGLARGYWREAEIERRITAHIGPAVATLDRFLKEGRAGTYDFIFIDADKTGYDAYYERGLELLRPGGLILIDNVLWFGRIIDPAAHDPDTLALRALNAKVHADMRVDVALLPLADGLTLARKR